MKNLLNKGDMPRLMSGGGLTGHEPLNGFGILHLNARLHDLILGRFLSADPMCSSRIRNSAHPIT